MQQVAGFGEHGDVILKWCIGLIINSLSREERRLDSNTLGFYFERSSILLLISHTGISFPCTPLLSLLFLPAFIQIFSFPLIIFFYI